MDEIDEAAVREGLERRAASRADVAALTGNPDVDRLLPAILTLVAWLLCSRGLSSSSSYARGFVDGAFVLIGARVAWGLKESFLSGSDGDRDALRWGVMWGMVAGTAALAVGGVYLMVG